MKAKTVQHARVILFLVVFVTLISVAGANAQTSAFSGRFTLPYPVRWNSAVLPAGNYTINIHSVLSPGLVQSTDGRTSAFVFASIADHSKKGAARLVVVTRGNERKVASLDLPSAGISLVYSPVTKAEQEAFAKAMQIETVPLVTARK